MPSRLPLRANLEQLRKQAKTLLKAWRSAEPDALARVREHLPRLEDCSAAQLRASCSHASLAEAQLILAREYGFVAWAHLKRHVESLSPAPPAEQLIRSLRDAAGRGDLAQLSSLLDAHPEIIDEPGGEGVRTALHQAVFGNSEAAVRFLLDRGANPNIRCEGDNAYPLHFAVEKQRMPIIRLLVDHGADTIGEGDYHELGVIGWATAWGHHPPDRELVEYLLAHGARHNMSSAVATGDIAAIHDIVRHSPAELERRMDMSNRRRRPLHLAVMKQQSAALQALLDLGADTDSLDEAGFSALDQAAMNDQGEMARLLLDRGAKVRLPAAVALNRPRDIERHLQRDPDALKPGGRWAHLIVRAAERSTGQVIDTLVAAGADANISDDVKTSIDSTSGYTALHAAAWHGNLSAIAALMRHGANVRAREQKYRGTPAGWADYAGQIAARDLILTGPVDMIEAVQYGLPQRVRDIAAEDPRALERPFSDYGLFPYDAAAWHTPLAYAVSRGQKEMVRLLLDLGADPEVRSPQGDTLLEIAAKANHREVASVLSDSANKG